MSSYLDQWIEYLKESDKSKNTIDSYKRDVAQFMDYIQRDITELNKDDIENYKSYLIGGNTSIKSVNRKMVSIKNYIEYLSECYNIIVNVKIKQERIQQQQYLEDVLTLEEFNKLSEYVKSKGNYRLYTILQVARLTGMRVSEMLQLQLNDIGKEIITIKGKGKYRDIFIPNKLQPILQEYLQYRIPRDTQNLFTSKTSKDGNLTRNTINAEMKKYGVKVRIKKEKLHIHNLRHLFALSMMDSSVGIDTLADILGHSNINTTRIYTRNTRDQILNKINSL